MGCGCVRERRDSSPLGLSLPSRERLLSPTVRFAPLLRLSILSITGVSGVALFGLGTRMEFIFYTITPIVRGRLL